jgi:hypothetical protein
MDNQALSSPKQRPKMLALSLVPPELNRRVFLEGFAQLRDLEGDAGLTM